MHPEKLSCRWQVRLVKGEGIKMEQKMKKAVDLVLDTVFPPRCPVCGKISNQMGRTCKECVNVFSIISEPICKKCGKQIKDVTKEYCLDCTKKKFHYIQGFPMWNYDKAMRKSVSAFKYHNKKEYGRYYAEKMAYYLGDRIVATGCQVLVPVPVHKSRLKKRGYNQAQVLADNLSNILKIPVVDDLLIRTRKTMPQKELSDAQRLKNLRCAFETNPRNDIIKKDKIKSIMLVDDIYTTGSTIEACTLELLKAGIEKVYFTSICIGKGYD